MNGPELGLLIGRHGSTIDALQDVASRAAYAQAPGDRKRVVVDAAGYRERREAALRRQADRAVADALDFGRAVELEPMSPHERKVVHTYLADRARRRDALRGRRAGPPPRRDARQGALGRNT